MAFQDEANKAFEEAKFFATTHGKITAVVIAVIAGLLLGFAFFH